MFQRRGQHRRGNYTPSILNSTEKKFVVGKGDNSESEPLRTSDDTIRQMRNILDDLAPHADVKIKDLPKPLMDKYRTAVAFVGVLYDTSNYPALAKVIDQKFGPSSGRSSRRPYQNGTVGAYFGGCLFKQNVPGTVPSGCSLNCINSVPPSDSQANNLGWVPCHQNVVLASIINGKFNFSRVNDRNDSNEAIIYVSTNEFHGFTKTEKKRLNDLGITDVTILSDVGNGQYKELLPPTNVDDIEIRSTSINGNGNATVTTVETDQVTSTTAGITSNNTWWIIAIVILIIIILILLFKNK